MGQSWEPALHPAASVAARCVVLRRPEPRRADPVTPPDLAASLSRRGIGVIESTGPYHAFAETCAAASEQPPSAVALIIVEPRITTPGDWLERIIGALSRHAPAVRTWRYDHSLSPSLRPIELAPDRPVEEPRIVVRPGLSPAARPSALRLAGDAWLGGEDPAATLGPAPAPVGVEPAIAPLTAPTESGAPLVSDEELAMLLADEWPEEFSPSAPAPRRDAGR